MLNHYMVILAASFYMAESASGQDEVNPAFWLATQAGKMGPSCPLGISRVGPARNVLLLAM